MSGRRTVLYDQQLHTHHIVHPAGLDRLLGLHTVCQRPAQILFSEFGSLGHVFSGDKTRQANFAADGIGVIAFIFQFFHLQ